LIHHLLYPLTLNFTVPSQCPTCACWLRTSPYSSSLRFSLVDIGICIRSRIKHGQQQKHHHDLLPSRSVGFRMVTYHFVCYDMHQPHMLSTLQALDAIASGYLRATERQRNFYWQKSREPTHHDVRDWNDFALRSSVARRRRTYTPWYRQPLPNRNLV